MLSLIVSNNVLLSDTVSVDLRDGDIVSGIIQKYTGNEIKNRTSIFSYILTIIIMIRKNLTWPLFMVPQ